ncbi:MAG: hypothetical protein E6I83_06205 [Chloroflexi bacterium]|nr:MAG: hypothetical protein E6I83_06205 [Chloroflexota bacterium]
MFRTMAGRTTRAFAAGALILSLTATTFAGSANAAPLADDKTDCSTAAHARNDAAQLLHTAWKAFDGDLTSLARDARKLQHETEKESGVLTTDARAVVASAKAELKGIASQAHSDIQAAVELGAACSDDEDSTTPTNKVKHEVATATADREEAKTAAKDKSKNKSNAKSSHSGKGKGRK